MGFQPLAKDQKLLEETAAISSYGRNRLIHDRPTHKDPSWRRRIDNQRKMCIIASQRLLARNISFPTNRWPSSSAPENLILPSCRFILNWWIVDEILSVLWWSWSGGEKEDKGEYGGGTEKGRKEGTRAVRCSINGVFMYAMPAMLQCLPPTHSVAAEILCMVIPKRLMISLDKKPGRGCWDGLLRKDDQLGVKMPWSWKIQQTGILDGLKIKNKKYKSNILSDVGLTDPSKQELRKKKKIFW